MPPLRCDGPAHKAIEELQPPPSHPTPPSTGNHWDSVPINNSFGDKFKLVRLNSSLCAFRLQPAQKTTLPKSIKCPFVFPLTIFFIALIKADSEGDLFSSTLGDNGTTDIYNTCNSVNYEFLKKTNGGKTHIGQTTFNIRKEEVTTKKKLLPYTFCHQRMKVFPCW